MRLSMLLVGLALVGCDKRHKQDQGAPEGVRVPKTEAAPGSVVDVPKRKDAIAAADQDMREVLQQLVALGGKPISTLSPEEARKQPSPADAVRKVLAARGEPTTPQEVASVEDRKIPSAAGPLRARIYKPKSDARALLPVVAYYHGGGFVIADLDTYDATPRALAQAAEAIVVSLDYRRAPEAKFPAAHQDAFTGYQWVVKNAASFGGDPKRIAVAGESAGGNLAANVAILARDRAEQLPLHVLLVYPVTQARMDTPSYEMWADAKPLDRAMMGWFVKHFTTAAVDTRDARISLVDANLAGLPQVTIINAEIDPLLSDGELLYTKLEEANVDVAQKTYEGVTHEFFGMGAVVEDAREAEKWAGRRLKHSFSDQGMLTAPVTAAR